MASIDATANSPDVTDAADPVKDESDGVGDAMENLPQDLGIGKKKKKRRNRLGKTRRAVTGFEGKFSFYPSCGGSDHLNRVLCRPPDDSCRACRRKEALLG